MKHTEFELQKSVCRYLDAQYPNVLYYSDTIASIKLTMVQAVRNKSIQKDGFKLPDLVILHQNRLHKGLFIELKIKSPFKKNGELLKNYHLEGQQKSINDLLERGYYATFSTGFDETKRIIDLYMNDLL